MILADKDTSKGISYERPSNIFNEADLKEEYGSVEAWYAQCARWVASNYNRRAGSLTDSSSDSVGTGESVSTNRTRTNLPVDEILENFRFFFGEQENMPYRYLTQDHKGGQLPVPFVNGQQIFRLIEVMNGGVRNLMRASKISVESLNPSRLSKKMEMLNLLETKRAFKNVFDEMERDMGLSFRPEGMQGGDIEDIIEKVEKSPIDKMEEYGLDVVNDIINKNSMKDKMVLAQKFAVIGRYCATYFTERGGRVYLQVIPPYSLILDASKDSDFNEEPEFIGFIEFLTPEEINQKWRLTADEKSLLKDLVSTTAQDDSLRIFSERLNSGIPGNGFQWINTVGASSRHIACVTCFWLAEVDESDVDGSDDASPLRVVRDDDETVDTYLQVHRATLIGNVVMKGYGREKNVVYHPNLQYLPMFPVRAFVPGIMAGITKSPVDRMKAIQRDIDAYRFKIREAASRAMGKVHILNGAKIGLMPGGAEQKIYSDLRSMGLTVVPGTDGENPGALDGKPMSETMDFSLERDVMSYVALVKMEDDFMKEVINASDISLGQQRSYIGTATQQQTMNRNDMGTAVYVDGFMQYYAYLCQYALNYAKTMYMDNMGKEEAQLVLSDDAIKFFENSTEFQLEDMMIRVDVEDIIDEGARQRLLDIALAMAQNSQHTGFDYEDYLDVEMSRTYSELRKRVMRKIQKRKRENQEAKAQQMMAQQAEAERNRQFQINQQAMSEQGKDKREMIKAEKDLVTEGFRAGQKFSEGGAE